MIDDLTKQQKLLILGLVLLIFSGLGVMVFRHSFSSNGGEIVIAQVSGKEQAQEQAQAKVVVHVSGAVGAEGVYRLKVGDRVVDALAAAGGASPLADLSRTNLAQKVKDGEKIVVPAKVKQVVGPIGLRVDGGKAGKAGKININTADNKTLCKITGVGKTTAQRILDYRAKNGPFSKLEELMKVKSIGKSKFNKIKDEITI